MQPDGLRISFCTEEYFDIHSVDSPSYLCFDYKELDAGDKTFIRL